MPRHRMTRREKMEYIRITENVTQSENEHTVATKNELREMVLKYFTEELDRNLEYIRYGQGIGISFFIDMMNKDRTLATDSDLRNSKNYFEWRKAVLTRDNFACRLCKKQKFVHAHHIKSWADYPEDRFAVDNGITLCFECHASFHPLYKHLFAYQAEKSIFSE